MTALQRITPPATEPVTLAEAKAHLRISFSDDDSLITTLISAARLMAEEFTQRSLITQGWRLWLDAFPLEDAVRRDGADGLMITRHVELPRPPLISIGEVRVYDENDAADVFDASAYFVDTASTPGRLALRSGATWPLPGRDTHGICIDYTAGYGAAGDVPQALKAGLLAHVAHLYENRGDGFTLATQESVSRALPSMALALYAPYRVHRLV